MHFTLLQVIPIYGRGGDNTDPRQKAQSLGNKEEDEDGPVPRRPAGQRIAPVLVSRQSATTLKHVATIAEVQLRFAEEYGE